ncbi:F-box domain protein [Aspergillus sp. HF37]|nr:F-box domain protein [Aspergillus sp. HF37]
MEATSQRHLYSLPNEVFVQILSLLPTRVLLPLATVSHRFNALVLRIIHYRLPEPAALSEDRLMNEYKLMLECYHPSSKLSEPHVFCKSIGSDGLSDRYEDQGSLYENLEAAQKLGRLTSLYSRFRPEAAAEERGSSGGWSDQLSEETMPVMRAVNLEPSEDFSQLCTVVNLVKVMPGSHRLLSALTIEEGILRLWRDWLKRQIQMLNDATAREAAAVEEEVILPGGGVQSRRTVDESDTSDYHRMLWVDGQKNVGLKLRVREKKLNPSASILVSRDEESYQVEIEELHIRTARLLLTMEQSIEEQKSQPRAMVFGAHPPRTGATLMI